MNFSLDFQSNCRNINSSRAEVLLDLPKEQRVTKEPKLQVLSKHIFNFSYSTY